MPFFSKWKYLVFVCGVVMTSAHANNELQGQQIYNDECSMCHDEGDAGAPTIGQKDTWGERLNKTTADLLQQVLTGKGEMPPRGSCSVCTDQDIQLAIEYMLLKTK